MAAGQLFKQLPHGGQNSVICFSAYLSNWPLFEIISPGEMKCPVLVIWCNLSVGLHLYAQVLVGTEFQFFRVMISL